MYKIPKTLNGFKILNAAIFALPDGGFGGYIHGVAAIKPFTEYVTAHITDVTLSAGEWAHGRYFVGGDGFRLSLADFQKRVAEAL